MLPGLRGYRTTGGAAVSGLVSGLAAHIESLLEVKHAIGLPYTASERHLRSFDAMCAYEFPGQATVTRAMAMRWAAARPGEHVNGQMRRITPVRQLAKHMAGSGTDAYVIPAGIPGGGSVTARTSSATRNCEHSSTPPIRLRPPRSAGNDN